MVKVTLTVSVGGNPINSLWNGEGPRERSSMTFANLADALQGAETAGRMLVSRGKPFIIHVFAADQTTTFTHLDTYTTYNDGSFKEGQKLKSITLNPYYNGDDPTERRFAALEIE